MQGAESMRQFNYHNKMPGQDEAYKEYDDQDVKVLEEEIENVIRCGTAQSQMRRNNLDSNIINVKIADNKIRMTNTAKRPAGGKRRRIITTTM
jgi:hypothetical protein